MGTKSEKLNLIVSAKDKTAAALKSISERFKGMAGDILAGNIGAQAATKALSLLTAGFGELADATKTAARIEVLANVVELTGKNAGFTTTELEANTRAIIKLGIAEKETRQLQLRFIQSSLDLADATLVARAAQDLAVIAGTNSSDTAIRLTEAIVKQRPILLKQFGIVANLTQIYGSLAKTLGKSVEELTDTEKKTAFLNTILEKSQTVAGAYERAMEDVGKRLTSLPRHFQNAQNAVGKHFLPAMGLAIDVSETFLKAITAIFGDEEDAEAVTKRLGDEFNTLALKIEILNTQLESGVLNLTEFKTKLDAILKGTDEPIEVSLNTRLAQSQMADLTAMMQAGLITGQELDRMLSAIGVLAPGQLDTFELFENLRKEEEKLAKSRFDVARSTAENNIRDLESIKIREDLNTELVRSVGNTDELFEVQEQLSEFDKFVTESALENLQVLQAARQQAFEDLQDEIQNLNDAFDREWSFLTDQIGASLANISEMVIFESFRWKDAISISFRSAASVIVREIAVRAGGVIANFIKQINVKRAVVQAAAAAEVVSIAAVATAQGSASAVVSAAHVAEQVPVRLLTSAYVSLAAAKAAASLGFATPAIIAAGATTKASLSALLLGFDDPVNDVIAFRHGQDYAKFFMEGASKSFSSPQFGISVVGAINTGIGRIPGGFNGSPSRSMDRRNTSIVVNISGSVPSEEFVVNTIVPAIEQAVDEGGSRIETENLTTTGVFSGGGFS